MTTNFVNSKISSVRNTVIRSLRNRRVHLIEHPQMPICGLVCVVFTCVDAIDSVILFEVGVLGPVEHSFVVGLHKHHIYLLSHSKVCHNLWKLYEFFLNSVLDGVSRLINKYNGQQSVILVHHVPIGPITFQLVRKPHRAEFFLLND